MKLSQKITQWLPRQLIPYKGIIWFFALMLITHFVWKLSIIGDPKGHQFAILGIDLTTTMYQLSCFTGQVACWLMQFIGLGVHSKDDILYLENGYSVRVIWGCIGIKQLYMFLVIMILYSRSVWDKIWFIPMGLITLYVFNLFRIGLIPWLVGNQILSFNFWHELFRISFYGLFFLLWLIWEEYISKRKS